MRHSDVDAAKRYMLGALSSANLNLEHPLPAAAAGTDLFPPGSGHSWATPSPTGDSVKAEQAKAESGSAAGISENPGKQAVCRSAAKYTREDSNELTESTGAATGYVTGTEAGGAECGAVGAREAVLRRVIANWDRLSEATIRDIEHLMQQAENATRTGT